MHAAAQNGDTEMVRDLTEHHADPKARNDEGKTAADLAEEKGREAIVKMLS